MVFTYHFVGDWHLETGRAWLSVALDERVSTTFGTFGVCVFVVVSGLTLGWAYGPTGRCRSQFWQSRFRRIYPTYWWVAVPLTALAVAVGRLQLREYWKVPVWWAGANFVAPVTFFPVVDSWWYIGLALQLYCAFAGFMWLVRRRGGPVLVAALSAVAPFIYVFVLPKAGFAAPYLATWLIGLSFVTIFCAGFLVSYALLPTSSVRSHRWVASPGLLSALAVVAIALIATALLVEGRATQLAAVGFVIVLAPLGLGGTARTWSLLRVIQWLAALSFFFYLAHSPWAKPIIGAFSTLGVTNPGLVYVVCLAVAFLVSLCFWVSFERAAAWVSRRAQRGDSTASK